MPRSPGDSGSPHALAVGRDVEADILRDLLERTAGIRLEVPPGLTREQQVVHRIVPTLLVRAPSGQRRRYRIGERAEDVIVRDPPHGPAATLHVARLDVVLTDQFSCEAPEVRTGRAREVVELLEDDRRLCVADRDSHRRIGFRSGRHGLELGRGRKRAHGSAAALGQEPAPTDDHHDSGEDQECLVPTLRGPPLRLLLLLLSQGAYSVFSDPRRRITTAKWPEPLRSRM